MRSNAETCTSLDQKNTVVVIRDGSFERRWASSNLTIDVANDGTIRGQSPVGFGRKQIMVSMDGKIAGGNLELDINGRACAAHLSLKKS